jgi:hypothetical protein
MSPRWIVPLLIFCLSPLSAAEPTPEDQAAMQATLAAYLTAFNGCDLPAMRNAFASSPNVFGRGLGPEFSRRGAAAAGTCSPGAAGYELTALARSLHVVTPDVTIADGYFRTIGMLPKDRAGSLSAAFVRKEVGWKLSALRFFVAASEKPYVEVEPASKHDVPGPDGWISLFDGHKTDAFVEVSGGPFPKTWKVENGLLEAVRRTSPEMTSHSLRTRDTYKSFELAFAWKVGERGNSGIKYHLFFLFSNATGSDATAHEYQLADDEGDPGAKKFAVERSGALYNQIAPQGAKPRPVGEFNESRIIVRGRHREHWLNGVKVVEYKSESGPPEGPIVIQHHQTGAAFREIKIRRLEE